jgi:4-hydroxy-3-polyprenylbenzoate decarboxylase
MQADMEIVVAITGASGAVYGRRLIEVLLEQGGTCHLIVSRAGAAVIGHELEDDHERWPSVIPDGDRLRIWRNEDLFAPFCSGSNPPRAMVIAPCSMGTLGRIASGVSESLLTRAADVCLKERLPLILAVRETPLNLIHIENMGRVTRAGAMVLPAAPAFYHRPRGLDDIVDHLVGKILDQLEIGHRLYRRWGQAPEGDGD